MKTALVVDDSKTMRDLVGACLQNAGYEVMTAVDGQDALTVLGDKDVTIITTDFNMPNMNGVQLVRALRDKEKYKYIPILLISTETDDKIKVQAREAGASGWVRKPFQMDTLIGAVQKVSGEC